MRQITVELFKASELSPKAREKARDWWRNLEHQESGNENFEPAETAAKILGITFHQNTIVLLSGKTRQESDIRYTGFSCQGDGASFTGEYSYAKNSAQAIRAEFPTDKELHRIADELAALQKAHGYRIRATITQGGRYYHSGTMDVDMTHPVSDTAYTDVVGIYKPLLQLLRDFADWIYDGLKSDYEYRMSDENVDDAMAANEYEFTADGTFHR